MSNGHVVIHDLLSNQNGLSGSTDPLRSTSDTDSMEDTLEFKLLMAYAKRRRPKKESPAQDSQTLANGGTDANGSASPQVPAKTEKEEENNKKKKTKKRRKGLKLLRLLSCVKPHTEDEEPSQNIEKPSAGDFRSGGTKEPKVKEEDELNTVASKLTKIADDIPFIPPEIETDAPQDVNVERVIGLLLRDAGDRLNEQELKDANIAAELFWNYSFFEKLMKALLTRMGLRSPNPDSPGPTGSPKSQIAVTCEVTSRLSAVSSLPRNRLLDHGARYLQQYYSSWVQQLGGYEEAFYSDDEDDSC